MYRHRSFGSGAILFPRNEPKCVKPLVNRELSHILAQSEKYPLGQKRPGGLGLTGGDYGTQKDACLGNGWKKILWQSGKIAFIFSISIETLQLLLRLGTFQLSDIFYNTVGGVLGGLMYCAVMKARKRL